MINFIYLPIVSWYTVRQRAQHLCAIFGGREHKVFHIHPHTTAAEFQTVQTNDCNVYEAIPQHSPYAVMKNTGGLGLHRSEIDLMMWGFDRCLKTEGYEDSETVVIVNAPYWWSVAEELKRKYQARIVYDVLDRFDDFEDLRPLSKTLLENHSLLVQNADLVSYSALHLADTLPFMEQEDGENKFVYLPNACDVDHWTPAPENTLKNSRAGYCGVISLWFDPEIVEGIVQAPKITLELVGAVSHPRMALLEQGRSYQNLIFRGVQDYKDLPGFYKNWSCGIIPFQDLPLTSCTDPVKFYEYMATGLPVVATELAELKNISGILPEEIRPVLVPAGEHLSFLGAVITVMANDSMELRTKRREWAKTQTWESRANKLLGRLGL